MSIFNSILSILDRSMETPKPYGWFHLMCFSIVILICTLIIIFRNKFSDKSVNIIMLITSIVFILFEIYKQLIMNFDNGKISNDWSWYIFPFQFCSTPMYVMLIASILKKGKVYNALTSYLGTYGLFAGLAVMFLPTTVFISTIGINIQTMVVHGGMVIIGVLLLSTSKIEFKWKSLLKASMIFIILCSVALCMNVIAHFAMPNETFNMFFISPWFDCELPILQSIQDGAPYIVFLLCYLIGFTLCAGITLGIGILCSKFKHTKNDIKN